MHCNSLQCQHARGLAIRVSFLFSKIQASVHGAYTPPGELPRRSNQGFLIRTPVMKANTADKNMC